MPCLFFINFLIRWLILVKYLIITSCIWIFSFYVLNFATCLEMLDLLHEILIQLCRFRTLLHTLLLELFFTLIIRWPLLFTVRNQVDFPRQTFLTSRNTLSFFYLRHNFSSLKTVWNDYFIIFSATKIYPVWWVLLDFKIRVRRLNFGNCIVPARNLGW